MPVFEYLARYHSNEEGNIELVDMEFNGASYSFTPEEMMKGAMLFMQNKLCQKDFDYFLAGVEGEAREVVREQLEAMSPEFYEELLQTIMPSVSASLTVKPLEKIQEMLEFCQLKKDIEDA